MDDEDEIDSDQNEVADGSDVAPDNPVTSPIATGEDAPATPRALRKHIDLIDGSDGPASVCTLCPDMTTYTN